MIVALLASASISAMADDIINTVNPVPVSSSKPNVATRMDAQAQLPLAELPQTPTPMSWTLIRNVVGPGIPPGWQIAGIEGSCRTVTALTVGKFTSTTQAREEPRAGLFK